MNGMQDQTIMEHPWVENYNDFEVVLVCTNEISTSWTNEQIIRGFQTWQFEDASTSGDERSFVHNETGALVRYDGDVLAIDYTSGELKAVIGDLFGVLAGFGWTKAEAYHPIETMSELLVDMAKCIPASLDFDVSPAKEKAPMNVLPAGQRLIENSRQLLSNNSAKSRMLDNNDINSFITQAYDEISSSSSAQINAIKSTDVHISLIDDEDDDFDDDEIILLHQTNQLHEDPVLQSQPVFAENSEPLVFLVPDDDLVTVHPDTLTDFNDLSTSNASTPYLHPLNPENISSQIVDKVEDEILLYSSAVNLTNNEIEKTLIDSYQGVSNEISSGISILKEVPINVGVMEIKKTEVVLGARKIEESRNSILKVGSSFFCFDLPCENFLDSDQKRIQAEFDIDTKDVIHLCPGVLNEAVRWNLIGEFDSQRPLMAVKIVGEIMDDLPKEDLLLATYIFNNAISNKSFPGLRDVFNFSNDYAFPLKSIGEPLFFEKQVNSIRHAISTKLNSFLLIPHGQGFLDLLKTENEFSDGLTSAFSLREISQSLVAKIYIVHVDVMDGDYALWVALLLRRLAINYGLSKYYKSAEPDKAEEKGITNETKGNASSSDIKSLVNSLIMEQFAKLTLALPSVGPAN